MSEGLNIGTLQGAIELEDRLTPKLINVNNGINTAAARMAAFGNTLSSVGSQMQSTGRFIGSIGDRLTFLAVPLTLATKAIVNLTTTFEKDMTKVVTVAGLSEKAMQQFRGEILKLGPAVAKGPDDLAKALYAIASVGMRGAEAMDILDRSARASTVGLGSTENVARAVVAAMTAYGKENLNAAEATDKLLAAVREGGAEASEFANTLGRVIGSAKQMGISFDETLASVATFTRVGVKADEAVTALRGTIAFLMKPSEGARNMLLSLGTSIQEVRDKVKKDGLADALIELVRLTNGNDDALGKIIPNVRALAGALANTGEQATAYQEILKQVQNSTGDLDKAFKRTSETAAFKFEALRARIEMLAVTFGSELVEALISVANAMEPLLLAVALVIKGFAALPEPIQTALLALTGITLLAGPFMSFGARFIEVIGAMIGPKGLGGLITYMTGYTTAVAANTIVVEANTAAQVMNASVVTVQTIANYTLLATQSNRAATALMAVNETSLATRTALGEVVEAGLVPMNRQLLLTGEVLEGAATKVGRFSGALKAAGIAGLILSIGAAMYELYKNWDTYTAPMRLTIELYNKIATALGGLILKIADATGLIAVLSETTKAAENVQGGFSAVIEDLSSIIDSVFIIAISDMKTAIYDTIRIIKESFIKVFDELTKKIAEFTGSTQQNLIAAFYGIAGAVVMAIAPLRDFVSILLWLEKAVPGFALNTEKTAKTLKDLADQSARVAAGRQGSGAASLIATGSLTKPEMIGPQQFDWTAATSSAVFNVAEGLDRVRLGAINAVDPTKRVREEAQRLAKEALAPLSSELQKTILNYNTAGKSASWIAEQMKLNEGAVQRVIEKQREAISASNQAMNESKKAIEERNKAFAELHTTMDMLLPLEKTQVEYYWMQGKSASQVAKGLGYLTEAVKEQYEALDRGKKVSEDWIEIQKEMSQISKKLSVETIEYINNLNQKNADATITYQTRMVQEYKALQEEIQTIGMGDHELRIYQLNKQREALTSVFTGAYPFALMFKALVDQFFNKLIAEAERLNSLKIQMEGLQNLAAGFNAIGESLNNMVGDIIKGIGGIIGAWAQALAAMEKYKTQKIGTNPDGTPQFGATGAQKAGAVLSGVGSVLGATGAGSTQQRAINGAMAGAAAGLAVGAAFAPFTMGISLAVGAVAGFTVGLIRGGLALTDYQKRVRQAAADFATLTATAITSYGSYERLTQLASTLGIQIETAFNSGDPAFLQATLTDLEGRIKLLNDAMQKYGITLSDLGEQAKKLRITDAAQALLNDYMALTTAGVTSTTTIKGMSTAINAFIRDALLAGSGIPPGLQPIIEKLITMGLLTENNARLMLGLAEDTMPALADIEAAAGRYGAKLDELGPKVQQLKLNDVAKQLAADFQLFTLAGVDMGRILQMMGKDIQGLVTKALQSGLVLPDSMKPLIQAMINAGTLTDEAGVKLTDMGKLKFAEPLSAAVDRLILKLDELIQKFLSVGNTKVPPVIVPWQWKPNGGTGPYDPTDPAKTPIPMASGGDFMVNRPTLFLAGEAGPERATFSGAGNTQFSTKSDNVNQTIVVKIGEDVIARASARGLPRELGIRGVGR